MAFQLPDNANEITQRAKVDVQRALPNSNPFLKNSWLGALIGAFCNRMFDFYVQLREVFKQSFIHTATESDLEQWGSVWGIQRLAATGSTGTIAVTGTANTTVPAGSTLSSSDGEQYTVDNNAVISAQTLSVTSLTRVGNTATVTTASAHNLASNVQVTIAGADQTDYNGTFDITITGDTTFTYQVQNNPTTPATGTITASFTSAAVQITSTGFGASTNQPADAKLTFDSLIAGVDPDSQVTWGTLSGGVDQETDEQLRARVLQRVQNPVALFNVSAIESKAREVAGVTRVFVQEITPDVGQVTVYFMRDNDSNPIPSGADVTNVKSKIDEIRPANTDTADLIVSAPTGVTVDFTFSALTPNTSTMQQSITDNLAQFFREQTNVGVNIIQDAYRSIIFNTVDVVTGDTVQSFTLSAPVGDIVINSGEIAVLGTVTYP